jgi:hypothetical protein
MGADPGGVIGIAIQEEGLMGGIFFMVVLLVVVVLMVGVK